MLPLATMVIEHLVWIEMHHRCMSSGTCRLGYFISGLHSFLCNPWEFISINTKIYAFLGKMYIMAFNSLLLVCKITISTIQYTKRKFFYPIIDIKFCISCKHMHLSGFIRLSSIWMDQSSCMLKKMILLCSHKALHHCDQNPHLIMGNIHQFHLF